MKYASIDVKKSAQMPPIPIKIHFTQQLVSRDLRRFRPSPFARMFMRLAPSVSGGKAGKTSNAGIKLTYPLVFGRNLATKSVFGNAVLDDNYCFFIFFFSGLSEYVLTAMSQSLVFIGYD